MFENKSEQWLHIDGRDGIIVDESMLFGKNHVYKVTSTLFSSFALQTVHFCICLTCFLPEIRYTLHCFTGLSHSLLATFCLIDMSYVLIKCTLPLLSRIITFLRSDFIPFNSFWRSIYESKQRIIKNEKNIYFIVSWFSSKWKSGCNTYTIPKWFPCLNKKLFDALFFSLRFNFIPLSIMQRP